MRITDKFNEFRKELIKKGPALRSTGASVIDAGQHRQDLRPGGYGRHPAEPLVLGEADVQPDGSAVVAQRLGNPEDALTVMPTADDFPHVHDSDHAKSHGASRDNVQCIFGRVRESNNGWL
jgi:hypothetical protein